MKTKFLCESIRNAAHGWSVVFCLTVLFAASVDAADIAEAQTPEIQELARGLGNDPLRIYNYVHDQIRPVFYFGSKKGAHLTLLEKSGNDFDQSALLVALLRSAGYSPTYEFGMMKIPYDLSGGGADTRDMRHWLGLSLSNTNWPTTLSFVGALMYYRGFPTVFYDAATSNKFYFHRVWVVLPIGGTNYYLDPGFKTHDVFTGIDLASAMSLNTNDLNTAATSGSTVSTANYVQNLDEAGLRGKLTTYTTDFLTTLKNSHANKSVLEVVGGRTIRPSTYTFLSTNRSFDLYQAAGYTLTNWASIPTNMMSALTVSLAGVSKSWFMPELKGQCLALTFDANGVADLTLDGSTGIHTSTTGGPNITVTISIDHPFGTWGASSNNLINLTYFDEVSVAASYQRTNSSYALVYSFDSTAESLRNRERRLDAHRSQFSDTSREVTTETLNVMGNSYHLQNYLLNQIIAQQADMNFTFHHQLGRMSQEADRGYYLDQYLISASVVPNSGFTDADWHRKVQSVEAANYFVSALEHGIIEQYQSSNLVAASTVKVIQNAAVTTTNKVYIATSANWNSIKGSLSNYDIAQLTGFVNGGSQLLLPENGKQGIGGSASWTGYGIVQRTVVNPPTGYSLDIFMRISGGYNGGYAGVPTAKVDSGFVDWINYYRPTAVQRQHVLDPVNMATGAFEVDASDLSLGQAEPRGLTVGRSYNSGRTNSNPAWMANGWSHNYIMNVAEVSAAESGLGRTTPAQMAPMLVAIRSALSLYGSTPDAKNWAITALIAKWGIDQLIKNAVSVSLGTDTVQFIKQPDGSFTPPAGSTMSLTLSGADYWLQQRHGNTFKFNSAGRIASIVDPYNKALTISYDASNRVDYVQDAFSRRITFNYSGTPARLTSLSEGDGTTSNLRSVSFGYANTYNADGDLVSVTDPEGKTSTFEYDAIHRITKTKDAYGRVIVHNIYDPLGRVSTQYNQGDVNRAWKLYYSGTANAEEDPVGGRKIYFFDEKSRLTGLMDALGNRSQTIYDGQDHAVTQISPKGETNQYVFNADHNLTDVYDPVGQHTSLTYDSEKRLKTVANRLGKVSTFDYNAYHQIIKITGPAGNATNYNVTEMSYFAADATGKVKGALDWRKDQDGYTNWFTYDGFGNVSKRTLHTGDYESFVSNYRGDVLTNIDFRGKTRSFTYNLRRQVTDLTAPEGVAAHNFFDDTGTLWKSVDALSNATLFTNSVTGKLLKTTLPVVAGQTNVFENHYDIRDWLDWAEAQPGERNTNGFDLAGRITAVWDPLMRTNLFSYNENGQRISVTTPLAISPVQKATLAYTSRGELATVTDALTNAITRTYDAEGNLTNLLNRRGYAFTNSYYDDGQIATTTTPTGKTTTRTYNNRQFLATLTEPSTDVTTLTYSARGFLTSRADGVGTAALSHDPNGNLTTLVEGTKTITRMYDELNRMTNYSFVDTGDTAANYSIGYVYDANSNLKTLVYPGGKKVAYAYDAQNRLVTVTDWYDRVTSYEYDAAKPGRLKNVWHANGTRREIAYDEAGQIQEIREHQRGSAGATQRLIAYFAFDYDGAGRIGPEFGGPIPSSYTEPTLSMTYDNDNRLATINSIPVTHDADGNMTAGPLLSTNLVTYTYDARNRLTGLGAASYAYDPDGNRLKYTISGQTTRFAVNPGAALTQVLVRTRPNGTKTFYVYGAGLLYEVEETERTFTYHYDVRGSTVALTDMLGNVRSRYEYSPYGQVTKTTAGILPSDTPFLYNGQYGVQTDPSGLCYMRARYYNPYIRRFINADPIGMAGGLNWYAYADGNPISEVDPFGLSSRDLANGFSWMSGRNAVSMNIPIYQQPYEWSSGQTSMRSSTLYERAADARGIGRISSFDMPVQRDRNSYNALLIGANHLAGTPVGQTAANINATFLSPFLPMGTGRPAATIATPYGPAVQSMSAEAQAALRQVQNGATVYKGGVLGRSEASGSQFLALESPLNPGYAGRYGIPQQNANFEFILTGRVQPGASVITRPAPGIPPNPGGGIEAVTTPGSFRIDSFHMP